MDEPCLFPNTPSLAVEEIDGQRVVRFGNAILASYRLGDLTEERLAMVSLATGDVFKQREVARAFGYSESTLSHLIADYGEAGSEALIAKKKGPKGPWKMTLRVRRRVAELDCEGLSPEEIAERINRRRSGKRRISLGTIKRDLCSIRQEWQESHGRQLTLHPETDGAEDENRPPLTEEIAGADGDAEDENRQPLAEEIAGADEDTEDESRQPLAEEIAGADEDAENESQQGDEGDRDELPLADPAVLHEGEADVAGAHGNAWLQVLSPEPGVYETRYAGAMVMHAALSSLGVWQAFVVANVRIGSARTFDLARTLGVLLFGFLLRFRSVEALRLALRSDLGALLGVEVAPEVRTLRRKLDELGDADAGFDEMALRRELARRYIASEPVLAGGYFVDGHFAAYYGKDPVATNWDSKRRYCAPGRNDVYVHDAEGRALFFVRAKSGEYLGNELSAIADEVKAVAPDGPWTLIFDRGGWSPTSFAKLDSKGVGFITWFQRRLPKRCYPTSEFKRRWCVFEGKRRSYRVLEKRRYMKGLKGPLRLIVYLDKKGEQVPVFTNLGPEVSPALVVHLLRIRWRQENSFKSLRQHFAIDSLVQYDVTCEPDERLLKNPKREEVKTKLKAAERELASVEAALGRELAENQEKKRPTVRGLKIANAELAGQRRDLQEQVAQLKERLKDIPTKIPRRELDPKAKIATKGHKKRVLVQDLKVAAHNGMRWLAKKLRDAEAPPDEAFALLRALLEQPGSVEVAEGEIVVRISPLDTPRYQRPVVALLEHLNESPTPLFGTNIPLRFEVMEGTSERVSAALSAVGGAAVG